MSKQILSLYHSQFTLRYLFSVFNGHWLMANGKRMENGEWKMVNTPGGGI